MATVNLGRIKPVFRGAYSGSTAYVIDDIVTHGNESFICIQAHGAGTQATSQTAYWTKLAAKGTDGTDVGTTITTQGDILYRDGSGLQRLAKGTANQQLRMNSSANAPEWFTASGGGVLQMKQILYDTHHGVNHSSVTAINANFKVDITPTAADSKFLLEGFVSAGMAHHDVGCTFSFLDSQVGTGDSNSIPPISDESNGSRISGAFAGIAASASDSATDDYGMWGTSFSTLYTPSSQNTNQRTFQVATKRNNYSYNVLINYAQSDHGAGMAGVSMLRVSEIANSIT